MRRMAPLAVGEHCDVCQHGRLCLRVRVTILHRDHGGLAGRHAARRHRVSPTMARAAQTRLERVLVQAVPLARRALRPATVRGHAAARGGRPLRAGPRERLGPPLCAPRGRHGPSHHGPRAPLPPHGARAPTRARRPRGHIPDGERLRAWDGQRPLALGRRARRRLLGAPWGVTWPRRGAAEARLGPPAPPAPPAPPQAVLGHQRLAAARARGATSWRPIAWSCGSHLLSGGRGGPGGAAAPRGLTPARDFQDPTPVPPRALGGRLGPPRVLPGSGGAQDAAALLTSARASWRRPWSFRRRVRASYPWASWPSCSWRSARGSVPLQVGKVLACPPRARAVGAIGWSESTASWTARA
jgi:hypothetical protein